MKTSFAGYEPSMPLTFASLISADWFSCPVGTEATLKLDGSNLMRLKLMRLRKERLSCQAEQKIDFLTKLRLVGSKLSSERLYERRSFERWFGGGAMPNRTKDKAHLLEIRKSRSHRAIGIKEHEPSGKLLLTARVH